MNAYKVLECAWNIKTPWMVDGRVWGKRTRRFFATKAEAEQDCRERNIEAEKYGLSAKLPDQVRMQALTAHNMIEPLGATLIEAAEFYVKGKSVDARSEMVGLVVDQYVSSLKGKVEQGEKSDEHYRGIKKVGKRLQAAFGDRLACSIQKHEIVRWIESLVGLIASSRDYYRRYATSIFAFAWSQGYVDKNPAHGIPSCGRRGEIGILTSDEFEALLRNCHPSMVPFYAIGVLAGLRPMSELLRLTWDKIHWDDRVIDVENIKTKNHGNSARNRYVQMSDNLIKWLEGRMTIAGGRVVPGNWRDFVYGSSKDRQVHFPSDREKAGIKDWPHDCMRHTYASWHYSLGQDAAKTAASMGNTPQVVFSNYNRKIKPAEAKRYLEIFP